jgi:hypothetical protein
MVKANHVALAGHRCLDYASCVEKKAAVPHWATVISEWRFKLYRSQPRMEAATNDVLSQNKISRLERGLTHPVEDLNTDEFLALLEAFKWSINDFERETQLSAPARLKVWIQEDPTTTRTRMLEHTLRDVTEKIQTALGQ